MASWTTFNRPDYNTRYDDWQRRPALHTANAQEPAQLPAIRLAIPRNIAFEAPENGLPVNPSPHPSTDPAIQTPMIHHRNILDQREYLSPTDMQPQRSIDSTRPRTKESDTSFSLSRSSSKSSFDDCQHCACCSKRKQNHTRNNSYSSLSSTMSSASPELRSTTSTPAVEQKKTFRQTFKFLQRSNSLEVQSTSSKDVQKARKRSTTMASKKQQPRKVVFEMVNEDDHWADE